MRHSKNLKPEHMVYTKQQQFNRLKKVIENPGNNWKHIPAITQLIANFETLFGVCSLSKSLHLKKLELYGRI